MEATGLLFKNVTSGLDSKASSKSSESLVGRRASASVPGGRGSLRALKELYASHRAEGRCAAERIRCASLEV
jgi:hypothetical protein